MLRIEFQGLKELERAMLALPSRVDRKILNEGLLVGARIVRDEAKKRAPELHDTSESLRPDPRWKRGALKRAIRASRIRAREFAAEAIVSVRRLSSRAIARVRTRQRKAELRRLKRTGKLYGGRRVVLGDAFYWRFVEFGTATMRARPFLRPAFESHKRQAVDAAIKYFRERVQLEIAKLGRTIH